VSAAEAAERVAWHVSAIDAALAAGVARIVYVSFLGAAPDATFILARQHWQTEQHIRSTGAAFTFLRDSLYLDVFPYFVGADGAIRGPAGDGRVGAVARDDIADAAVAVLAGPATVAVPTNPAAEDAPPVASKPAPGAPSTRTPQAGRHDGQTHDGQTYDLTGPAAVSLSEIAAELSAASGREIRYEPETISEAYASRAHYGAPRWEVRGWVSSYAAIATGELALVTDDVATLTEHPPTSLAQFVAAHPGEIDRMVARLR
jgi:uncharacterized protein YbjT (DUF2867 family)